MYPFTLDNHCSIQQSASHCCSLFSGCYIQIYTCINIIQIKCLHETKFSDQELDLDHFAPLFKPVLLLLSLLLLLSRTDGCVDQVLEKQADMIGYLKQHTAYLSQQLLKLQEQLSARHVPKEEWRSVQNGCVNVRAWTQATTCWHCSLCINTQTCTIHIGCVLFILEHPVWITKVHSDLTLQCQRLEQHVDIVFYV